MIILILRLCISFLFLPQISCFFCSLLSPPNFLSSVESMAVFVYNNVYWQRDKCVYHLIFTGLSVLVNLLSYQNPCVLPVPWLSYVWPFNCLTCQKSSKFRVFNCFRLKSALFSAYKCMCWTVGKYESREPNEEGEEKKNNEGKHIIVNKAVIIFGNIEQRARQPMRKRKGENEKKKKRLKWRTTQSSLWFNV